jgi:L-glyceraldehyde 3-phosphate reductase
VKKLKKLNAIAEKRGQSLAQFALVWVLRDARVTSALIGARTVEQLDNSLDALAKIELDDDELAEIEKALK